MFEIAEYVGTIAFAISGFFVGVRAKLDFLGVLVSVFLTAFGGGIIRDIIVDRTPYSFTHDMPGILVISMMVFLILFRFHKRETIENRATFIISDSIGLVSFSITGVLALAFVTAVGGGIARDVIINEIPFVFKTGFYGTVALLVGVCVYILDYFDINNIYTISIVFVVAVLIRVIAYYRKWSIPLV